MENEGLKGEPIAKNLETQVQVQRIIDQRDIDLDNAQAIDYYKAVIAGNEKLEPDEERHWQNHFAEISIRALSKPLDLSVLKKRILEKEEIRTIGNAKYQEQAKIYNAAIDACIAKVGG